MTLQSSLATGAAPAIRLLTAKEAAEFLKVSISWLAKARIKGEGALRQHRTLGPRSGDRSCRVGEGTATAIDQGAIAGLIIAATQIRVCSQARPGRAPLYTIVHRYGSTLTQQGEG